jgi:hypothetical protein
MILYHGTTAENARRIMDEGFKPGKKYNWKVKSKPGFVYLSKAYAPFYAQNAGKSYNKAIIKVEVKLRDLYPEDDFVMYALGKPSYTQEDLDKVNLEKYKPFAFESLKYMGNACAKPENIKVIGCTYFNDKNLWQRCDPCITPMNYKILGKYYEALSKWIYMGKVPEKFKTIDQWLGLK